MSWYNSTIYKEAGVKLDFYNKYLLEITGLKSARYMQWINPAAAGSVWSNAKENEQMDALILGREVEESRAELTNKFAEFLKQNGFKKNMADKLSPMLSKKFKEDNKELFDRFDKLWHDLEEMPRTMSISKDNEGRKRGVISADEIYEQLIMKALFETSDFSDIKVNYTAAYFKLLTQQVPNSIGMAYNKFKKTVHAEKRKIKEVDGWRTKKLIVDYDQDLLFDLVKALYEYVKATFNKDYMNSLYEIAETGKGARSMHEFFVRDILGICGVDFKVEIPVSVAMEHNKGVYRDSAIVDFYLSNGEYFEIFGVEKNYGQAEEEADTYDKRKGTKMLSWPNLWYWDATEYGSRTHRVERTLAEYTNFLDTSCYHTSKGGPQALLGLNYTAMMEERVPLLGLEAEDGLNLYWAWTMNLPAEKLKEFRDKVQGLKGRKDLEQIPMVTSQYNVQDYYKGGAPNIKTIYQALLNGEVADGATPYKFPDGGGLSKSTLDSVKTQELLALYFQREDVLMPYLEQISDSIDQSDQQYQWNTQDNIPFPDQEPQEQPQNTMQFPQVPNQSIDQPRIANRDLIIKTALSEDEFNKQVKCFIKESEFFNKLFHLYEVPIEAVDGELRFHIVDLDGRHAKSKGEDIYINKKLMSQYSGDIESVLHFVVHEMIHWLTRQRESMCYFSDPEELEAFSLGIAYEIYRGKSEDEVRKIYFPIIEAHFEESTQAEKMYKEFLKSAYVIIKNIFS